MIDYMLIGSDASGMLKLAMDLRRNGISVITNPGRSKKGQMKQANREGVKWVVFFGDKLTRKCMRCGEQKEVSLKSLHEGKEG